MKPIQTGTAGFTLIEIIVTLTVASILAIMLVQFMGTSISRSMQPTVSLQEEMALQAAFENMNADYKQLLLSHPFPITELKDRVDSGMYGSEMTTTSSYIRFDSNQVEAPCDPDNSDCKLLKVTISTGDHALTSLFAR